MYALVFVLVAKSCLTLCDPMDCTLPGSPVHGISQARTVEWIAISFFRGTSQPKDQTQVSCNGRILYHQRHLGSPSCMHTSTLKNNFRGFTCPFKLICGPSRGCLFPRLKTLEFIGYF